MADHTSSPQPRHSTSPRRARRRRAREAALRREIELRTHAPTSAPDHPPRRVAKPRAPLWKIIRRATGILLLLGLVQLIIASLTARSFQVRDVTIAGCAMTPEDEALALAQPLVGQNWIRARTSQIEEQLEAIPTVKEARITRVLDWPPRLHVAVEERQAFARVGAGETWCVVDETGTAFREATKDDEALYAITSKKLLPQIGSSLPEKEWQPVVEITHALQNDARQSDDGQQNNGTQSNWSLRRIYFDEDGTASLRLQGGYHDETLVRLGGEGWEKKLVRARQALAFFERTGRRAAVLNLVSYKMPQWTQRKTDLQGASTPVARSDTRPDARPDADPDGASADISTET